MMSVPSSCSRRCYPGRRSCAKRAPRRQWQASRVSTPSRLWRAISRSTPTASAGPPPSNARWRRSTSRPPRRPSRRRCSCRRGRTGVRASWPSAGATRAVRPPNCPSPITTAGCRIPRPTRRRSTPSPPSPIGWPDTPERLLAPPSRRCVTPYLSPPRPIPKSRCASVRTTRCSACCAGPPAARRRRSRHC